MAKIKYDVTGVDHSRTPSPPVPPGVYDAEVERIEVSETNKDGAKVPPILVVQYHITEEDWNKSRQWDRIQLTNENVKWKMDQFLQAVGVETAEKEKGTLDTESIVGTPVRIRVVDDNYTDANDNIITVNKVKAVFRSVGERVSGGTLEEEPVELDAEADEEEEPEYSVEDLSELAELADAEDEQAIQDLYAFFESTEYDPDQFATWAELVETYANEVEEPEAEGEEEESEAEVLDYNTMGIADLRSLLTERGLSTSGPKTALIKRPTTADSEEPF